MTPVIRHCELKKNTSLRGAAEAIQKSIFLSSLYLQECGFYSIKSSSVNVIELICSEEYSP